jgi:putative transposase
MAGNYSQVYIHLILVVKHNHHLIPKENQEPLFEFISDILRNRNQRVIIVNGTSDHLHILCSINPNYSVSEVVRVVKSSSTTFINQQKWLKGRFCWRLGYAALSYGHSQLETLMNHIRNQDRFHNKVSCREEFVEFLKKFNIDFDEKHLFRFPAEEG